MTRPDVHQRVYRLLLRLYPAAFRARFSEELVQLFGDQLRDAKADGAPAGTATTWLRTLGDLAVTATSEHARRDRTMAHSLAVPPSISSRTLGLAGILGGAVLLWPAFLPGLVPFEVSPDLFNLRLALFDAGAMAIIFAVYRRQAAVAPALALAAAAPALLANAWHLVMIVLVVSRPGQPGVGDYGPVYIAAWTATLVTDAWFGLATLRSGVVARWGPLALAVGSLLALAPAFRLTSDANPTIFGPLALAGLALNGIGWILLGLDIATRRTSLQRVRKQPAE